MRMQNRVFALLFAIVMLAIAGCTATESKRGTGEYMNDAAISTSVKSALFADPETSSTQINVETFRGVVQLSGFADSPRSAQRAVDVARGVSGVKSVESNIKIRQQVAPTPQRTTPQPTTPSTSTY